MDELQRLTGIAAPTQLSTLRSKDVLHKDVVDRDQMPDFVESSCKRVFA